jgi:hypothetical protein
VRMQSWLAVALPLIVSGCFLERPGSRNASDYVGNWKSRSGSVQVLLNLRADGAFEEHVIQDGVADTMHASGRWVVDASGSDPELSLKNAWVVDSYRSPGSPMQRGEWVLNTYTLFGEVAIRSDVDAGDFLRVK